LNQVSVAPSKSAVLQSATAGKDGPWMQTLNVAFSSGVVSFQSTTFTTFSPVAAELDPQNSMCEISGMFPPWFGGNVCFVKVAVKTGGA
jgi:hypothetical protein